ncbi:phage tail protein [Pseudomonas aeruginosa]|uniref:phage tail protein n=1 Tax=Pseudomonas aeruginosa TaxID=287 RepID=UPI001F0AD28B|nr:phage tail protein [Pseudomonas aeruginosa]
MIDQNSQFFAILTNIGAAKQANADALGIPWKITQMGVGDAGGTDPIPSPTQTALINERRRAPLNHLKVDPQNAAVIIAEQIIPENVGGWWIREIGLYDADNELVAVANCAPSFKPLLNQGSGRTQVVRMNLIVSNSANVELKIDPAVVLATRAYVLDQLKSYAPLSSPVFSGAPTAPTPPLFAHDQKLATTEYVRMALGSAARAISYTGNTVLDEPVIGSILVAGSHDRDFTWTTPNLSVLPTGASFHIVNISGSTLTLVQRTAADHYISADDPSGVAISYTIPNNVTATISKYQPGLWLISHVSRPTAALKGLVDGLIDGTKPAGKAVQLANSRKLTLSGQASGSVQFDGSSDVTIDVQLADSLALTGSPSAPTPAAFDRDSSIATTEYVRAALGSMAGAAVLTGDATLDAPLVGLTVVAGAHNREATWTTPQLSAIPQGASLRLVNLSGFTVTLVQRSTTDRYISATDPSGTATTYIIPNGTSISLTKYQASMWLVEANPSFPALRSSPGYQKLPSGLILQFGSVSIPPGTGESTGWATLPIAFPNGPLTVVPSLQYGGAHGSWFGFSVWSGSITPTAIACTLNSGSTPRDLAGVVNYVAIGY